MKKQILKTSVLASVLLSMGMGMAHAADIGKSANVNVSGSVAAPTCALNIDKTDINLGTAAKADFIATNTLVKPQDFTISLTGCDAEINQADNKMKRNVDLKITGTQTLDGDGYFGDSSAAVGSLAVGLVEKSKTVLLANNSKINFADQNTLSTAATKTFSVGLVAKNPSAVTAGTSVSAPLTFQLVTR
ncbi:fimbrial protein [Photorhabdus heterorhabditis]|uniref:fimbrial protein n=1 Tax=Photorhabdus heterorhabditis TaxID=880156 RepID=UPI001BD4B12C|nr:fimbrial protein [Photorhabdus heterorhabditis]MBS9442394.1 type 1 fimbrial protein [Photorhabdus heterorhabditis]